MTLSNKNSAVDFLMRVIAGDIKGAYAAHTGPGFRHHNPYYAGDLESLRKGMEDDHAQHAGKKFEIRLALEDGKHVAVHSRLKHPAFEQEISVVHLFRFEEGKIVEFWDVAQVAPEQIVNQNGMF